MNRMSNCCPRCGRVHSGICGIPPAHGRRILTGGLGGLAGAFKPAVSEVRDVGLSGIRAKITQLEAALAALLPYAAGDPAMATEAALLKQAIDRLREFILR